MVVCSNRSLQIALSPTVYVMVVLFICSSMESKECGLQLTEKMKAKSVVFRNIDMKLCQTDCVEDCFVFASCSRVSGETEKTRESSVRPNDHLIVPIRSCGSKVCSETSQCVEDGCGMVCLEASPLCDLHNASKIGDFSRVNVILSQGRANIDCQEWIGRTPVMWAALKGHREVVELLVTKGANVKLTDRFGVNILHSACLGGDVDVVKYVLSQDMVDIDGRAQCKRTPMMLAAENGHKEVVELLVGEGADMSLVDEQGDNILNCACRGRHVEVVKYILSQDKGGINRRGWRKKTPVMEAAEMGKRDVVECLVELGANLSLVYDNGSNILHMASYGGHLEVVKYIVSQNKVDINSRGWKKKTPVMVAAAEGHKDVVEFLVEHGADLSLVYCGGYNILHLASYGGHLEVVKYIVSQNKVDINRRGWKKKTPVMVAAAEGHKDVVEFLVEHGADLSLVYCGGYNILHLASYGGHLEVVKYIVSQNKVDINSRGCKKKTPVMVAAAEGHKDVVEFLVEHGADLSLVYCGGYNILHLASYGGHLEVVKYIVSQNKVDINRRGWKKKTPVMMAAAEGHKDVVEFLVEHGADLSLVYSGGKNILHLASYGGHLEVVKYIVSQNKVDINSRGCKKKTPVMMAAAEGHKDVVEFLVEHGADLSLAYSGGKNILHLASYGGHLEVVKYIVSQNKVDINSRGCKKKTPVVMAAEMGEKDVVKFLVEHRADLSLVYCGGKNILHLASYGGHLEVVKYIVSQNKVDINSRGCKKKTPVMMAAAEGHKDVVEFLVEHGADLSLVYSGGKNILHLASYGGHLEVVKYIVSQNKVDINSRGCKKKTPVMMAAEMGEKDVVKFLVEHRADLSLVYCAGNNILHLASYGGHLEVVKYIVSQNKVDINRRGWKKKTPVMMAAEMGEKDVVKFLVEHGADLSLVFCAGYNILHLACKGGHLEAVKYIVSQNKVDINSRGWKKKTPVMVASEKGHKKLVEFLVRKGADV